MTKSRTDVATKVHSQVYCRMIRIIGWWWLLWYSVSVLGADVLGRLQTRFEPYGSGFLARAGARTYFLTQGGVLRVTPQVEMRLAGARSVQAEPLDPLPAKSNYLRSSDRALWRTGVPNFARVRFRQVYPGVDLIYHGAASDLEYDFLVNPGASPQRIVLEFSGAEKLCLDGNGDLLVSAGGQELHFHRPLAFQGGRGGTYRISRPAAYRLLGSRRVAYRVGPYDKRLPPLIDPVLTYSAGVGSGNPISAIALDSKGDVFVAGATISLIPLANPLQPNLGTGNCSPYPEEFQVCPDIFVTKLDPTGTQIVYSTYLGDNGFDVFGGLAVDPQGDAYVAFTSYPAQYGVPDSLGPGGAGLVRKLNPDGSALVYSESLGANTRANGIALDSAGNLLVTGTSYANAISSVNAIQAHSVIKSMFVTKDGGSTWNAIQTGALQVNALAISSSSSSTLYAATSSGLLKSVDSGMSWTNLIPSATSATLVALDPRNPSTVFAVYNNPSGSSVPVSLARSLDGGTTWTVISSNIPFSPTASRFIMPPQRVQLGFPRQVRRRWSKAHVFHDPRRRY
jgi:hypothetical protein